MPIMKYLDFFCSKLIAESQEMNLEEEKSWQVLLNHANAICEAFSGPYYEAKGIQYPVTSSFRSYTKNRVISTLTLIQETKKEKEGKINGQQI